MNCVYHIHNPAAVSCNACGRPLCPACDHRIKGFPYCQDCIVSGIDLLRERGRTEHVPFVEKRTSPLAAALLSFVCPGLGAAYNGQMVKAIVYFGVFVGLFQMAVITRTVLFVLAFVGMWLYAALDAWRTAQTIRAGLAPDTANDILVKRFSGNPKLWGVVLSVLGLAFVFQAALHVHGLMRALLPIMLIGLGVYILRGYIFKPSVESIYNSRRGWPTREASFVDEPLEAKLSPDKTNSQVTFARDRNFGGWKKP